MDQFLSTYPFKNKPFVHQQAYLQRFWEYQVAALFADMGTGKSFMLINNVAMLYDRGKLNGFLIVAPKGVYRNWYDTEIPKHLPDHVVYRMAIWSPNPRKAEQKAMDELFTVTEDLKILVMNVEAFSTAKGAAYAKRFLLVHNAMMAIDLSAAGQVGIAIAATTGRCTRARTSGARRATARRWRHRPRPRVRDC